MRGAFVPVLVAGLTPFIVLGLVVTGAGLGLVLWQPPTLWTTEFGNPGAGVTAVSADTAGLYAAGFVGYPSSVFNATSSYLFINRYDFNGHQAWTQKFGNPRFSEIKGIGFGGDGVYIAARANSSAFIRKYDLNGNEAWTSQFASPASDATTISVGTTGVYVGGSGTVNGTSAVILRDYDFNGNVLWTNLLGNAGGPVSVYAGSNGVYVTGSYSPYLSDTHAFVSKYDFNGAFGWTRQVDNPPAFTCNCAPSGISGDATGMYVAGNTQSAFPGQVSSGRVDTFVRKYDWNGNELWTIQFGASDYTTLLNPHISVNPSGVYLAVTTGESRGFVMKYDGNGNHVWSLQIQPSPSQGGAEMNAISVGENGVYAGGSQRLAIGQVAFIAEFSQSSSLILFGFNPPFSFGLAGLLVGFVALSILWLRRQMKRKVRPHTATKLYGSSRLPADASFRV